ncbi:MAG: response regulator, partial [Bacteroidetes bacterium]|nr:response regulator [Bacteroidota bacterium]
PVNNFNIKDYKGGNQNWGIESVDGEVYIGNNEGLLEFDGLNWYLHELPNKTIVRSVKVIGNKIYTGSYEEFGYWERLKTGELKYTSLSEQLTLEDVDSQTIWDIYYFDNKIVFKSFWRIYILSNEKVELISPDCTLMAGCVVNDSFIVFGKGVGLFEYKNGKLDIIPGTEVLAPYKVQSIILLEEGKLLIGTDLNGCFEYSNGKVIRWEGGFNDLLKEHELNALSYLDDIVYVGTIKNGLYLYHLKNRTYQNINIKNGLQNNTVLDSYIDKSNILWLALDNGVSSVNLDSFVYYLNPFKENIGAVYDMVTFKNEVYLATNTGVYRVNDTGVFFIKGSQGHTWSLTVVGNQIICGHNSKTFVIENGKFTFLSASSGGYVFQRIPESNGKYIQGNYGGLTFFEKNNNTWRSMNIGKLNFPIKNIVFESSHIAWVAHAQKGIYKIMFSDNYEEVIRIDEKFNKEFDNIFDIRLFNVDRNISFYSSGNWYVYNSIEDRIESFESLNKMLGEDQHSIVLNEFLDEKLVLKDDENTIFIRNKLQDSNSQKFLQKKYYDNKLVRGEGGQKAIIVNDSLVYIALYNDVLVVNTNNLESKFPSEMPKVSRLRVNGNLQELNSELYIKSSDTLQLDLSIPYYSNYSIEYSLDNKKWLSSSGNLSITDIDSGETNLMLRTSFGSNEF